MNTTLESSTLFRCALWCLVCASCVSLGHSYSEWKYFNGACAIGSDPTKNLRYTKALGMTYTFHVRDYEEASHSALRTNLYFVFNDPHKQIQPEIDLSSLGLSESALNALKLAYPNTFERYPELPRGIFVNEFSNMKSNDNAVWQRYKQRFEALKCWANTSAEFPDNLAHLQVWGGGPNYEPCPNFHRQSVIDEHVAAIVDHITSDVESAADAYLCGGIAVDVPNIWDEFSSWESCDCKVFC